MKTIFALFLLVVGCATQLPIMPPSIAQITSVNKSLPITGPIGTMGVTWSNIVAIPGEYTAIRTNSNLFASKPWNIGWEGQTTLHGSASFPIIAGEWLFIIADNQMGK